METQISLDSPSSIAVFHNQFPARGWKPLPAHMRRNAKLQFFITNSPQGDGNNLPEHSIIFPDGVFHNQFPARGWKRYAGFDYFRGWFRFSGVFHNQFPARGWKPDASVFDLNPILLVMFFRTNSPQGD
jgi:hypothetical protein